MQIRAEFRLLFFHTYAKGKEKKNGFDLSLILHINSGHSLSWICLIINMWQNFATNIIETKLASHTTSQIIRFCVDQ